MGEDAEEICIKRTGQAPHKKLNGSQLNGDCCFWICALGTEWSVAFAEQKAGLVWKPLYQAGMTGAPSKDDLCAESRGKNGNLPQKWTVFKHETGGLRHISRKTSEAKFWDWVYTCTFFQASSDLILKMWATSSDLQKHLIPYSKPRGRGKNATSL